jgi:uncharacterized protein with PIN domain
MGVAYDRAVLRAARMLRLLGWDVQTGETATEAEPSEKLIVAVRQAITAAFGIVENSYVENGPWPNKP